MNFIFGWFKTIQSPANKAGMLVFKRFYKDFLRPHWYFIAIAVVFMIIFSASTTTRIALLKPMINGVFGLKDMKTVYQISIALAVLTLFMSISQYIYSSLLSVASIKIINNARVALYNSFLKQDLKFYNSNSPGSLMSVMINDINAMNTLASELPVNLGKDFFLFITLLGYIFIQEPIYALVLIMTIVFVILPIRRINKKVSKYITSSNNYNSELLTAFEQSLNSIKEIKSYNTEEFEKTKVAHILRSLRKMAFKMRTIQIILPSAMELAIGFLIAGMVFYGGYAVIKLNKDPGSLVVFIAALILIYQPLKRLTEVNIKIKMGFVAIGRYYSFLDQQPTIVEAENAKDIKFTNDNVSIKVTNVNFGYIEDRLIFKNFNFTVKNQQKVALVGRSGAGKTTIVALLSRFYDPIRGEVLIGGHNIKDLTFNSLRSVISYVGQDVTLFDDTIMNNIKYGTPKATEDEVIQAAKKAYCYDFIMASEHQFSTVIGARGIKLSGGQKQRISIARALLKNSPILLLDEATSALDSESEQYIQQAIQLLSKDKTTVVIAHRLSTVINSDVICVLDNGEIVEEGTHNSLIKQGKLYKYLYDLQFKDQDAAN